MPTAKSDFLRAMLRRGDFHDANDFEALDAAALKGGVVGYIGFDATAPSLHVGNLMQILKLRIMQQTGQKPIALVGGGTTKIGDPSGKDEMRQIRGEDEIQGNVERIKELLGRFLTFGDGPTTPSSSTMRIGWTLWSTFRFCGTSGVTSRSTGC